MVARALYSLLIFATSAFAGTISKRDGCSNFNVGLSNGNPGPYSLFAEFSNGQLLPLELSTFEDSASSATSSFLGLSDLGGPTVGNVFQLDNSGIVGFGSADSTWISGETEEGGPVPFTLSPSGSLDGINTDYCAVISTSMGGGSPFPSLAVHGDLGGWSVCNRTDNHLLVGVVYNAGSSSASFGFDSLTCLPIQVVLQNV